MENFQSEESDETLGFLASQFPEFGMTTEGSIFVLYLQLTV